jgi:hypothetical protein
MDVQKKERLTWSLSIPPLLSLVAVAGLLVLIALLQFCLSLSMPTIMSSSHKFLNFEFKQFRSYSNGYNKIILVNYNFWYIFKKNSIILWILENEKKLTVVPIGSRWLLWSQHGVLPVRSSRYYPCHGWYRAWLEPALQTTPPFSGGSADSNGDNKLSLSVAI